MPKQDALDTIWEVPADSWKEIEPLIAEIDPPKATGHKREDPRKMLDAIILRMRSGRQQNGLPRNLGDGSTIHRTFQRWEWAGIFPRVCAVIQSHCNELGGVGWEWQSADTVLSLERMMNAEPGLVDTGSHIILVAREEC